MKTTTQMGQHICSVGLQSVQKLRIVEISDIIIYYSHRDFGIYRDSELHVMQTI